MCPKCKIKARVTGTRCFDDHIERYRKCSCGISFKTVEHSERREKHGRVR